MIQKIFFALALFGAPALAKAKYQVCSVTINSSDEIETFREFLPAQDFEFVELLPREINPDQDHSSYWLNSACAKGYQCDILIISGHFGGVFFGESGYALPTELLEEKACQKSCPGILSNVKEIFLFGCNTLADKTKDKRTYTEYLQVLLDDGMARETAERVVAARYSPLETPFYERMNFIFSGSSSIYGFDRLSPLGEHIRRPLRNYLRAINQSFGGYANYLKEGLYKRSKNTELFQQLPRPQFSLNQASISLAGEDPEQIAFFKNKCRLYGNSYSFNERMLALQDIFESGHSGSAFFATDYFLNRNKKEAMEGQGREIFRSIRSNPHLANEFRSYYNHLNFLPYVKLVYLNALEKFQWADPLELHVLRKRDLLELIKTPGPEAYVSLLLLLRENQIKAGQFYISKADLPESYVQNIWGLLILEKLKVSAPEWQISILKFCESQIQEKPALCYQTLNTLAHIEPSRETAQTVMPLLNYEDEGLIFYTIRLLGQSGAEDCHIHNKISGFLTHPDPGIRAEALEALGFLQTPCARAQSAVAELLPQSPPALAEDIFWTLSQIDVNSPGAQKAIIQYANQRAGEKKLMEQALKALGSASEFSDYTLSFLYKRMESREDLDLLFFIIEVLAKNKNLRDLGIHYRFLSFQTEESAHVRQMALKGMAGLSWMHPEAQTGFLAYLKDEDQEVRSLALSVLKNIKNLQPKTLVRAKDMHEEENIPQLEALL